MFAIRKASERRDDKYEKNFVFEDLYTGIFAYGYQTMHTGGTESLYRTINSIILSKINRVEECSFLDLGCGTGRTLYDLSELYPKSWFVGLDYSYNMLARAKEILLTKSLKPVDLSYLGFDSKLIVNSKKLTNVNLIQASAADIPFEDETFDCITNTFLIDRVRDRVEETINESVRVLKKGGLFILADPMNFELPSVWDKFKSKTAIVDLIKKSGIEIKEYFTDLIYRQLSDSMDNYQDWRALVVLGFKK